MSFPMQTNEWLLDTPSPGEVAYAEFQMVRRGYDPVEVQAFARAVSAELQRLAAENADLRDRNAALEARANAGMDEGSIAQYLGEETTRLLSAARDTAAGLVTRAEEKSRAALDQATEEARRMRSEANSEAIGERRQAADDARHMLSEATAHRRQMLAALAARRDETCNQIEDLLRGRDVLIRALSNVGETVNGLVGRLDAISADPGDFPNLDPLVESAGDIVDTQAVLRVSEGRVGKPGSRGDALGPMPNRSEAPEADDEALLVLDG